MNKPLCELTHAEALAALQAAESKITELTAAKAPAARRARSLRRPDDANALPLPQLYHVIMSEISRLMSLPEAALTPAEEALLDALVDVVMVYEQSHLPGWLFPAVAASPPEDDARG
jgi:hypothetical protein